MIKKLKRKFCLLAMLALLALLSITVFGMNALNYRSIVEESDIILSVLSQNKGGFPDFGKMRDKELPDGITQETPYESRFFSAILDENNSIIFSDTTKIASVSDDDIQDYCTIAAAQNRQTGFIDIYRFSKVSEPTGTRIIFLDCSKKLDSFKNFLYSSIVMALAGYIAICVLVWFSVGKILKPVAEGYEKQKRFITDAGHEIKTPLTIINANVDILEMEMGENESLSDISSQTKRLRNLTDDLVMLSRMEETGEKIQKIEFPLSEIVAEVSRSFCAIAESKGISYSYNIQPLLTLNGNDKTISKLINLLLDNAMKYCTKNGNVDLSLTKQGKNICLTVRNNSNIEINENELQRIFDRFYRTDKSRNSETGGHGIGLSVAKAIVDSHGGKIQASILEGNIFLITVLF